MNDERAENEEWRNEDKTGKHANSVQVFLRDEVEGIWIVSFQTNKQTNKQT